MTKTPLVTLLAVSTMAVLFILLGRPGGTPAVAVTAQQADTYDHEVARRDAAVLAARARVASRPGEWLVLEQAAAAHIARARLTGRYDDYVEAEALLDRAFALAPEGGGPLLTKARLEHSLHRLDASGAALDAIGQWAIVPAAVAARVADLRVAIALQRGQVDAAARLAASHLGQGATAERLVSAALVDAAVGRTDEADARFVEALESLGTKRAPYHRAWLHLQRGILDLDRGRYDHALEHYHEGDSVLPGWWLIREHMAEIHVLLGNTHEAARLYREVTKSDDHPELLHAFADLETARGRTEAAERLMERAGVAHERRLKLVPSAAGGHALDYFVAVAEAAQSRDDPQAGKLLDRAVELARADHARRPGAGSKTALAAALLASGDVAAAREMIEAALATKFRSTDLFVTAHEVYLADDDGARAAAMRAAALKHNPLAFE